jgi:hypothetical protein
MHGTNIKPCIIVCNAVYFVTQYSQQDRLNKALHIAVGTKRMQSYLIQTNDV